LTLDTIIEWFKTHKDKFNTPRKIPNVYSPFINNGIRNIDDTIIKDRKAVIKFINRNKDKIRKAVPDIEWYYFKHTPTDDSEDTLDVFVDKGKTIKENNNAIIDKHSFLFDEMDLLQYVYNLDDNNEYTVTNEPMYFDTATQSKLPVREWLQKNDLNYVTRMAGVQHNKDGIVWDAQIFMKDLNMYGLPCKYNNSMSDYCNRDIVNNMYYEDNIPLNNTDKVIPLKSCTIVKIPPYNMTVVGSPYLTDIKKFSNSSRMFKIEDTKKKVCAAISVNVAVMNDDTTSADHCNHTQPIPLYQLTEELTMVPNTANENRHTDNPIIPKTLSEYFYDENGVGCKKHMLRPLHNPEDHHNLS
jgi:hypothetical protein